METDKLSYAVVLCGGATGSHVTGSDVSHVTGCTTGSCTLMGHVHRRPPPPSIHVYTLFFRIEKNHPEIVFFCQRLCKQGSNLQFHSFGSQKYHNENAGTIGVLHNIYIYRHYMKIKIKLRKRYENVTKRLRIKLRNTLITKLPSYEIVITKRLRNKLRKTLITKIPSYEIVTK